MKKMWKKLLTAAAAAMLCGAVLGTSALAAETVSVYGQDTSKPELSITGITGLDNYKINKEGLTYVCPEGATVTTLADAYRLTVVPGESDRDGGWRFDNIRALTVSGAATPNGIAAGATVELTEPGVYAITLHHYADMLDGATTYLYIPDPAAGYQPAPFEAAAQPCKSIVAVDGITRTFEGYNIGGYNYFKLRDIAASLIGNSKCFEVLYDNDTGFITVKPRTTYTTVGGELTTGDGTAKHAVFQRKPIRMHDNSLSMTAYTIGGNNYFRLRDVAKVMNFGVTYDASADYILINTSQEYYDT